MNISENHDISGNLDRAITFHSLFLGLILYLLLRGESTNILTLFPVYTHTHTHTHTHKLIYLTYITWVFTRTSRSLSSLTHTSSLTHKGGCNMSEEIEASVEHVCRCGEEEKKSIRQYTLRHVQRDSGLAFNNLCRCGAYADFFFDKKNQCNAKNRKGGYMYMSS